MSLLVITNPLLKLPLFVSLTQGMSEERRRQQANWAGIYAGIIMAVSLVGGNMLLAFFGISYGAMRISGGLVVAAIGYQMLFGGSSPNKAPIVRRDKDDYAFFPIAMPGIAGPGTIAVVIGFSTEIAELSNYADIAIAFAWTVLAIIFTAMASWAVMRYSDILTRRLGPFGYARPKQIDGLPAHLHRRAVHRLRHPHLHGRRLAAFSRPIRDTAPVLTELRPVLSPEELAAYSTVTLLARLRGLSTSVPRASAVW